MKPKILLFDIETAPNLGYTWGKYDQNVIKFVQEWWVLCFSYKWLGQKRSHVVAQCDFDDYDKDRTCDRRVMEVMHGLLDEADAVVAHNGDRFDVRKVNARMAHNKLLPPSDYAQIDTLKVARQKFAFNSNKLDDIGNALELGRKVQHEGFKLWEGCMAGDRGAWRRMKKYARQDVELLEELYTELRPWMKTHPNLALGNRPDVCPRCGENEGFIIRGHRRTATRQYRRFQCKSCGSYSSERLSDPEGTPPSLV